MQEDFDVGQRDDVIIFNEILSKSSHNIKNLKNYRKLHHDLIKRTQAFPNSTQVTNQKGFIWTIDISQRNIDNSSQQKMKVNFNSLPLRRSSVTAGHSRRKNYQNIKSQARTLNLSNNIGFRQQQSNSFKKKQPKQNKYGQLQKKYNKGPIKDKYLVNWLNSLLLQACQDQKFDTTVENPALKKYGLDENSLRSKGIKPQNLTRIYKSLFVYSIGFNDLLKQICEDNINLRKTIWKVFSVLLQYCAEGDFQTVIAQIQRDKLQKIQNLTGQILKRQKIIQNNQEINQKKNNKIFKQIKQLRDENKNLLHQKQILMQQFKQAQQSFNQQVTLRLKYQNKINQIHGVYTEIQNKHFRLVHDHNQIVKEVQKLRIVNGQQNKLLIQLKKDNQNKNKDIEALQKNIKYKFQLIDEMENKKHWDAHTNIQNVNNIKDLKAMVEQKIRQISQQQLTINNINLIYQTQKLSHQQTSQALAASLQENGRLHSTIQQQMRDLNTLLYEKRNFGMKTSEIQAEVAIITKKLQQKTSLVNQLIKQIQSNDDQSKVVKAELQVQQKVRVQLEQDLKICFQNIKDMKNAKNEIEQQNNQRRRKMACIDEIIDGKDNEIKQQKIVIEKQIQQISELKQSVMLLQSKTQVLEQKIKSNEQYYNKKFQTLKNDRDKLERQFLDFNTVKKTLELQRDRIRMNFQEADLNLKNQKFQRTNLKVFYDNSLNSNQQKNEQIKKLDIKISQLNQTIGDYKRKMNNLQFVIKQKQKQFQKQKAFWMERSKILLNQSREKRFFIHPMIHEDVCQNYINKNNSYEQLKSYSTAKINQLTQNLQNQEQQLKSIKQLHKGALQQSTIKYEILLQKKSNQLLYQINKNAVLKQRNEQLEMNVRKYQGHNIETGMQRQQRYLNDIKQKKQQIETLLKDLQKVHDANRTLRQSYLKYEQTLPKKQQQLVEMKNMIEQNKQKFEKIIKQKQKLIEQKAQQIKRYKEIEQTIQRKKQNGQVRIKSRQGIRSQSGKKYDNMQQNKRDYEFSDSKRSDMARKIKGAVIYYAK